MKVIVSNVPGALRVFLSTLFWNRCTIMPILLCLALNRFEINLTLEDFLKIFRKNSSFIKI